MLSDASILIARETSSLGEDRVAVRCNSNSPGVHNASLSELSLGDEPSTLSAADDLASAEVPFPALDLLLHWLGGVEPGRAPARGLEVGREIALQLAEADEHDAREVVLRRLARAYPESAELREELEEVEGRSWRARGLERRRPAGGSLSTPPAGRTWSSPPPTRTSWTST